MAQVVMKILADERLRKEPKLSSDIVSDGTGDVQVFAGDKVTTGAKDSVQEIVDDREITWVFVEAIEGDDADKKKGFVSSKRLVAEGTAVPRSPVVQPFSITVDKAVFAEACYLQAVLNKTNPAYLYALAFALSGDKWSATQVQAGDPTGVFRFAKETWQLLLSEPEVAGFQVDQIKFPTAQCVVAAMVAAKSANLLQGLITDRGLSAVDLMLAHLFADNKGFGSNAAAKILQAEKANKGQRSEDVIKADIYPDSAAAASAPGAAAATPGAAAPGAAPGSSPSVSGSALRAAFFQRNVDIFKADGSATIAEALKACADKLTAGFAAVADLVKALEAQQDPTKDCQVSIFDGHVPKDPRDPVLGGGGGTPGVGGGIEEAQGHSTRKKPISAELRVILEYAGRKTGIDVEIYSGGQPATGPNRTGSHRHDVGPGLVGAADLRMLDTKTRRILDSGNQDDRKRIADFITASAAAGATGIGHARDYMGTKSTHIGGGSPVAVWGAGATRAGAPDWVVDAFERGRAHTLTSAQVASAISELKTTPIPTANLDTGRVRALASARQRFVSELNEPDIHRLVAASTNAEVGGMGLKAEQYYIESVFNRATARKKTLRATVTDGPPNGYYPSTTINKLGNPVPTPKQAQIDQIIADVMAGANESNFATGNESGTVHSGGAPVTRNLGPGKERFVQEIPDRNWVQRAVAAAARGDTNIA